MESPLKEQMKGSSEDQPNVQEHSKPLVGEALEHAIRKQIEFYFSSQNLANDAYLVSLMDAEMFVPLETISNFRMMKKLTNDIDFIRNVIRDSKVVAMDDSETKIKPIVDSKRKTLIIRDAPEDVTQKEIEELFTNEKKPQVKAELHGYWYCEFEEEDDCLKAFFELKDKSLRGSPVKARVKSQNVVKSFYVHPSQEAQASGMTAADVGPLDTSAGGRLPLSGQQIGGRNQSWMHSAPMQYGTYGYDGVFYPTGPISEGRRRGGKGSRGRAPTGRDGRSGKGRNNTSARVSHPHGRKGSGAQLNMSNFPPLPSVLPASGSNVVLQSGYTSEFKKYSREDTLDVLDKTVLRRPDSLITEEHAIVLTDPLKKGDLEIYKEFPENASLTFTQIAAAAAASGVQPQRARKASSSKKVNRGRKKSHAGEEEAGQKARSHEIVVDKSSEESIKTEAVEIGGSSDVAKELANETVAAEE